MERVILLFWKKKEEILQLLNWNGELCWWRRLFRVPVDGSERVSRSPIKTRLFFSYFPFKQTNLCSRGATDVHLGSPSKVFLSRWTQHRKKKSLYRSLIEKNIVFCFVINICEYLLPDVNDHCSSAHSFLLTFATTEWAMHNFLFLSFSIIYHQWVGADRMLNWERKK